MPRRVVAFILARLPSVETRGLPARSQILQCILQEAILKFFIRVTLVSLVLTAPALAQKLVDPSTVAPEYREAAEKRRAEQIRQRDCAKKAEAEKVMPRDRTPFLLHCLEADAPATSAPAAATASSPPPTNTTTAH